jgi:hypothetical protein
MAVDHFPRGFGKGKSPRKFSFTYEDYARIIGCSPEAARKHAQRGHFDPKDLVSVLEFVKDRLEKKEINEEDQETRGPSREMGPSLGGSGGRQAQIRVLFEKRIAAGPVPCDCTEDGVSGMVGIDEPNQTSISGGRDSGRWKLTLGYARGDNRF